MRIPAPLIRWHALVCAAALLAPAAMHAAPEPDPVSRARDRVLPSLVHIEPVLEVFEGGRKRKIQVTGSGVIIRADGLVLTNNHVVEKATYVRCTLANRERLEARVLGRDPQTDLALIRLVVPEGHAPFPAAALSRRDSLEMGESVVALGSPLGLARSMTVGVVSAPDRYFPPDQMPSGLPTGTYNTWIQTDAAINPGNSGGPLVDLRGEVVGINARAIPVFGENLGFAIPVRIARWVIPQLEKFGEVRRATLGIIWQPTQDLEEAVGVKEGVAMVGDLFANSPAASAGLQVGDLVTAINGKPVRGRFQEELPELHRAIAELPVGATVKLTVQRGASSETITARTAAEPAREPSEIEVTGWGLSLQDLTPLLVREQNLPASRGALVSGLSGASPGRHAGIRPGDVVVRIEGAEVTSLESVKSMLLAQPTKAAWLVEVLRGSSHDFFVIEARPEFDPTRGSSGADDLEFEFDFGEED